MIVVTLLELVLYDDLLTGIVFSDKIYAEGTCRLFTLSVSEPKAEASTENIHVLFKPSCEIITLMLPNLA
jgi:hypothetical protein